MDSVSKRFGATRALSDVSLAVGGAEVHALVGENGAGKSTLMKILAGVHRADTGRMQVDGARYQPAGPASTLRAGVAMIHQELMLAPHLTVEENILLGQEQTRFGFVRRGEHRRRARQALARLSQGDLPLQTPVRRLPIALKQLVEIARALVGDARVLIFDEPTSSLTEDDTRHLFRVIRELREAGLAVIYISHFLEEVAEVADTYSVLRDGEIVGRGRMTDTSLDDIVRKMVGRDLDDVFPHIERTPGEPVLRLRAASGAISPRDVDLEIRRGEIFGLAGLVGAGRSELVRLIFGLDRLTAGEIRVAGAVTPRSPRRSIRQGIGFVSENRKEEGLALALSVTDNLTLTRLKPYARLGLLNLAKRRRETVRWAERVACKVASVDQAVDQLSGGNQQKVAIARLLHQQADVLLLDEPTRGIDIGTKAEIYRLMGELARQGKAVVMVSSYLPELMHVCDRIGVMCRGRLRAVRAAADWTDEEIMHYATGREDDA